MMDSLMILAETVEQTPELLQAPADIVPIDWIWSQVTSLSKLEAMTFISFGVVCLLYGWRVFRVLVVMSFFVLGLIGGIHLGEIVSAGGSTLLGIMLGIVLAIISIPMMRWAVCLLGAAAGGLITAGVWHAFSLPPQYIWAGGLAGVIAGGMMSFIIFRISVMLFSSLTGSGLMVTGMLALLYLYPSSQAQVDELVHQENWFLPIAIMIPTAVGVFLQNKFIKGSQSWAI